MIHVWNNRTNSFGTGEITKVFSTLEPGVNVGNPTFSKNSPHIIAFDYTDSDGVSFTYGANLLTGNLRAMLRYTNQTGGYASYSTDDKRLAYTYTSGTADDPRLNIGYVDMAADKISVVSGTVRGLWVDCAFAVYYGTGTRQLGLRPTAAFSADTRSGGNPLIVQFVDLSENSPTAWRWTFQGGIPATSNQQNPRVTYIMPGTYPVRLTATNSYGNHELVREGFITAGRTNIETIIQESFTIVPNPATDHILLKGINGHVLSVNLIDLTGKTIPITYSSYNEDIRVDVSGLRQGMYLLQVLLSDGKTLTQKFLKK
jgi:PKD repeat protein